jgi:glycosyltransferase involved in cell wall biosynthesis
MVSVLILTRNEEHDLPGCLDSVSWADDVHVFDSMSTDRTAEIASDRGVRFWQRQFDNYASQRNAALDTLPFKHDWIFILDCDERLSHAMFVELKRRLLGLPPAISAFRVRRNDYFLGGHLKRAQIMPFYTRLIRAGCARYAREVNEVLEVNGEIADLETPMAHYPFSKGLARWFEKHNLYSTMEARIVAQRQFADEGSLRSAFTERDFHKRRVAQKAVFYRMPLRPLVRWAYILFVRRGILDGYAGFTYATLQAFYEYMIVLKTREIQQTRK